MLLARWLPASASINAKLLLITRTLRGFADGAVSVILPSYLIALGFSSLAIGAIVFGTLFGSALLTLWVGLARHRFGPRLILIAASTLMFLTGLGFFSVSGFWPLFLIAIVGTMNPSSGDVSVFLPAEQTALAEAVALRDMTAMFSIYNVGGGFGGALGALAAGLPTLISRALSSDPVAAQRAVFLGYGLLGLVVATIYLKMEEAAPARPRTEKTTPLAKSRGVVLRLSALFSLDSFGGGFVVQSLLALWLFHRFQLNVQTAGAFFFLAGLLAALSQLASAPIAGRIGRIRTMVYTHIPANAFMVLAAFMPGPKSALTFLLMRSAISQMDVPARQSYVMAVVPPEERAAAASVTNVPRSLATAFAPLPAGALLDRSDFGWPLICAGGLKLIYDLLLLVMFKSVRPTDEAG
ncbi:MAG TPA: MFS transporter [Candidatus Binataceae bacterium]|nr:MFS transporter [Candidatus Binataceae bacterium]